MSFIQGEPNMERQVRGLERSLCRWTSEGAKEEGGRKVVPTRQGLCKSR